MPADVSDNMRCTEDSQTVMISCKIRLAGRRHRQLLLAWRDHPLLPVIIDPVALTAARRVYSLLPMTIDPVALTAATLQGECTPSYQ